MSHGLRDQIVIPGHLRSWAGLFGDRAWRSQVLLPQWQHVWTGSTGKIWPFVWEAGHVHSLSQPSLHVYLWHRNANGVLWLLVGTTWSYAVFYGETSGPKHRTAVGCCETWMGLTALTTLSGASMIIRKKDRFAEGPGLPWVDIEFWTWFSVGFAFIKTVAAPVKIRQQYLMVLCPAVVNIGASLMWSSSPLLLPIAIDAIGKTSGSCNIRTCSSDSLSAKVTRNPGVPQKSGWITSLADQASCFCRWGTLATATGAAGACDFSSSRPLLYRLGSPREGSAQTRLLGCCLAWVFDQFSYGLWINICKYSLFGGWTSTNTSYFRCSLGTQGFDSPFNHRWPRPPRGTINDVNAFRSMERW